MSIEQTAIVIVILLALAVLTALHDIQGSIAAPIFTAALAGTLGYVGGNRKNGG